MAKLNSDEWLTELVSCQMTRLTAFAVVGLLDLATRHPGLPLTLRNTGKHVARAILDRLREDGLKISKEHWRVYKKNLYQGQP